MHEVHLKDYRRLMVWMAGIIFGTHLFLFASPAGAQKINEEKAAELKVAYIRYLAEFSRPMFPAMNTTETLVRTAGRDELHPALSDSTGAGPRIAYCEAHEGP